MKPALSNVCSLNSPLEKDVEDYAAGACHAIELWLGKLDAYLDRHSAEEFRELIARHDVVTPVAAFQGGLLVSQGERRREHWDSFRRRLTQLRELGIDTLVLAGDIHGPLDQQALDRVRASLVEAAAEAGQAGLRLALEFQASASFANNLQTAAALVAEVDSPYLGLCLDVFHYYTGPSKPEDLGYLSRESLFHVQMSDVAGVPRELASDADRVLPGDGDFQLAPLVARLEEIGYEGYVSVELMNPRIWQVPPRQFGEIAMTAVRRVLGQASLG